MDGNNHAGCFNPVAGVCVWLNAGNPFGAAARFSPLIFAGILKHSG